MSQFFEFGGDEDFVAAADGDLGGSRESRRRLSSLFSFLSICGSSSCF
jgi:hypothetical protein